MTGICIVDEEAVWGSPPCGPCRRSELPIGFALLACFLFPCLLRSAHPSAAGPWPVVCMQIFTSYAPFLPWPGKALHGIPVSAPQCDSSLTAPASQASLSSRRNCPALL